ncbi:MAG: SH3 domain-containing protein, partial [Gemmatimonadaceae bacterium]
SDPLARFTKPAWRIIVPAPPDARRTPCRTSTPPPIVVRRGDEEPTERPVTRSAATNPTKPAPVTIPEGYEAAHEPYSWGTYLRRSYPAIGVILLLGAVWIWSARLLSGGPSVTPTVPLVAPTVVATVIAVPVITPTAPGAAAPGASALPVAAPGTIGPGANIIIQTPGGAGANIRQTPATGGTPVTALDESTALTITGASRDADGYTWWPVTGAGVTGWVAGSLIAPAP